MDVGCEPAAKRQTELDFVLAMRGRTPAQCCGPLVTLPLIGYRLELLEASFHSPRALAVLWDGLVESATDDRLMFRLCVAHWLDLSYLAGFHGHRCSRRDWMGEAATLLKQVCRGAGWDAKEIANMMVWQRVRLT